MEACNVTLKKPHFFQIILEDYPGKGLKKLWIPRRFMRVYGGEISKHVEVEDPSGKKWIMEWSRSCGETWFKKGFRNFSDYYSLKHGHILVFKYKGNSRFSLVILDKTATEISYPIQRTRRNVIEKPGVAETKGCDTDSDTIHELEVPDSDFKDFEEDRKEESFRAGQVWAVYSRPDFMQRFYARINKVLFPGRFKVEVTWLEANPGKKNRLPWVENGLESPDCGMFKHGTTDYLDRLMFSHLMFCEKVSRRNTYKIVPRKGETWAIFRNKLNSEASIKSVYFEYEFVEILSEYREGVGVFVAYLRKVMGFVSVFCRAEPDVFVFTDDELDQFSHRIPSLKLMGNDKFSLMKNSFELDPAALPSPLWRIKEICFSS